MRIAVAAAALAACTPEIVSGAYLCGPEGFCPEGQVCNGPDNLCVSPRDAKPFACGAMAVNPDGDDAPATGTVLMNLSCSSVPSSTEGCLGSDDERDFFQLDVPAACTAARIEASITYPVAFQPVAFVLSVDGAAPEPVETPCSSMVPAEGHDLRCLSQAVQAGRHYAIGVVRDGGADCGGTCRHNRYQLRIRLATP